MSKRPSTAFALGVKETTPPYERVLEAIKIAV
ncbi:uncharacterized protein METZ01_LOCUS173635 [marine metagenome]|uniref:Uncharacterized protein n=1 Tax=marine metagenome TaxID=408172 RepID=A0A382C4Z0_9ZZZZ